ncbi:MAG TPA: molybdopterin-dependent oxidoreductase [Mycobacteriales bacterium]|nr:molybdopterin-dependent oxidoreductase [Mycobacteriales bacterium]
MGRRVVLGLLGLGAAGVAAGPWLSEVSGRIAGALSSQDPTGLSALIPGAGWRYYTVTSGFPYKPPAAYRLAVTGNVGRELTLTVDDLRAMPRAELTADFQCVTGWRVPNVRWEGVRLSQLLDRASADSDQKAVQFVSYDGTYTESLTMQQARRSDVLVVDRLDGKPIERDHGGPVRLLVAPMYGYKSCKWLSEIRVVDQLIPGYWERLGYDQNAWVGRSNGRTDAPTA